MSRTNDLRQLVQSMLKASDFMKKYGIKEVYHKKADDEKMYPHIVYTIKSINLEDSSRKDYIITVDIYTKDEKEVNNIADDVEDMFNNINSPNDTILPTFFLSGRNGVPDEDKNIQHEVVKIQIQLYER